MKSWEPTDEGFLIEGQVIEGGISLAEWYGVDEV